MPADMRAGECGWIAGLGWGAEGVCSGLQGLSTRLVGLSAEVFADTSS